MSKTAATPKKASKKTPAVPAGSDDGDEFHLDIGSFVSSERRELQDRFDTDFEDLILYVDQKLNRFQLVNDPNNSFEPRVIEAIVDGAGRRVYLDEIIVAMVAVAKRRDDPDFTEADLGDVTNVDLLAMARRRPKARTSKRSSSRKT